MSLDSEQDSLDRTANERIARLRSASVRATQSLLRVSSREELLTGICDIMVREGGYLMAWIGWLNPQTKVVVPAAFSGEPAAAYLRMIRVTADFGESGQGPTGFAIREGKPFVCNDFISNPMMAPWKEAAVKAGIKSSAAFPFRGCGGRICGTLNLYSREIDSFQPEDLVVLEEIVSNISYRVGQIEDASSREKSHRELRDNEKMFREFAEASGAVFWISKTHPELIVYVNSAFERTWERPVSELYRRPRIWMDAIHLDEREQIIEKYSNWIQGIPGSKYDVEYRIIRPDGQTRWIHDRGFSLYEDEEGNSYVAGIAEDVTERKAAQEALIASHRRYRTILDNMMEGCMIIGYDWTYIYVNEAAARHGYQERENLIGRTMMSVYPGIERSAVFARYKECMENRNPQTFKSSYTFEDGTVNWYEFRVSPVLEGIFVLSLDITEHVRDKNAGRKRR